MRQEAAGRRQIGRTARLQLGTRSSPSREETNMSASCVAVR